MSSNNIGSRIIDLRERKGLSQKELAERIPVSPPTLSRWENGVVVPPLPQLERISVILDTSLEEIFSGNRAEYDKLRKRLIKIRVLLISVALLVLIGIGLLAMPKYKVIHEEEAYSEEYGKNIVVYVKPVFLISEGGSFSFGNKIAQRYYNKSDYEMVKVIFVKSSKDYDDENNVYYSNYYFPDSSPID